MATTLGVISDTHGLLRPEALQVLRDVDTIIHAGDVGTPEILERLRDIAPVHAIRGNIDTDKWACSLAPTLELTVEGCRLYVVHDVKDISFSPALSGYRAVISGHSHRPGESVRDGVLYLNPGSAGPRRFKLPVTAAKLFIAGTDMRCEILPLKSPYLRAI